MKKLTTTIGGKTSHVHGKWVEKITHSEILICACGNKYLKTRANQITCVRCIS